MLYAVMTALADGLQIGGIEEEGGIAAMGSDVINDGSGGAVAELKAENAKRGSLKLGFAELVPAL